MSFFSDLKAERLIAEIRGIGDPMHPDSQKAFQKLAKMGAGAIPKILDAVAVADKKETAAYVEILAQLVDNKTFPILAQGLVDGSPRTIAAVGWALTASTNYSPSLLIDLLGREDISKPTVVEIIAAQKNRFSVRELLQHAYNQESNEKAALFRIIGELADASTVSELVSRIEGKDSAARMHIIGILSRFNRPEVSAALQTSAARSEQADPPGGAQCAGEDGRPGQHSGVCQLLRDADLEVQNRAIDVVVRAKDPDTMKYLIEVLKDENEYARRAGVEVLNHLGTAKDIKQLLQVIKDDDWWVRTRAADALGKIGGPRVVDAVIELIKDEDEEVRRAAIEILNQTKDERAVNFLLEATRDKDWWVSERAIDALGEIGSKKAVPVLTELLSSDNARGLPAVIRALGKIGDTRSIEPMLPLLAATRKGNQGRSHQCTGTPGRRQAFRQRTQLYPGRRRCCERRNDCPSCGARDRRSRRSLLQHRDRRPGQGRQDGGTGAHAADREGRRRGSASRRPKSRRSACRSSTLALSSPAKSSRAATSTSRRSARAPSARWSWSKTPWSTSG